MTKLVRFARCGPGLVLCMYYVRLKPWLLLHGAEAIQLWTRGRWKIIGDWVRGGQLWSEIQRIFFLFLLLLFFSLSQGEAGDEDREWWCTYFVCVQYSMMKRPINVWLGNCLRIRRPSISVEHVLCVQIVYMQFGVHGDGLLSQQMYITVISQVFLRCYIILFCIVGLDLLRCVCMSYLAWR